MGAGGQVYVKTASRFEHVDLSPLVVQENLRDVEVIGAGSQFLIGGDSGRVLRWNGTWTSPKSQSSDPIHKMSFDAADHGFAIGQQFAILAYR